MATLKVPLSQPNALSHSNFRNERSIKRSTKPAQKMTLRRSERLAKQHRAKFPLVHTVGPSSSDSAESSASKRLTTTPHRWQQPEAAITPQQPQQWRESESPEPKASAQPSLFESMTNKQLARALSYYYYFPESLPYRASGAFAKADGPTPEVRIKFDEDIFSRKIRLRPVPDDELESVNPFTI